MASEMTENLAYTSYISKMLSPRQRPPGRRVITYGTFDLLHEAHLDQLRRARALGTYLIVAVLTDIFDAGRGKRFLAQDVVQRIENVRQTKLADLVVLEECDDKINNVLRYNIDVVAVFDSWEGPEAYVENLRRYCEVAFIPEEVANVSSTALRSVVSMGAVGTDSAVRDLVAGAAATAGVEIVALRTESQDLIDLVADGKDIRVCKTLEQLYESTEAVYLSSELPLRTINIRHALQARKHVLCASPLSLSRAEAEGCFELAAAKGVVLLESIPSAFTPAIERMTAIAQNGKIGRVLSIAVNLSAPLLEETSQRCCTSVSDGGQLCVGLVGEALLPIVRILYGRSVLNVFSETLSSGSNEDPSHLYKLTVSYDNATATVTIGHGVIIPETLTVIGSEGYLTMPAPWRETSRFHLQFKDINFEEASDEQDFHFATRRGGYRFDLAEFATVIKLGRPQSHMATNANHIQIATLIEQALACHQ
ncbi:NAD(P)-binding protein [Lophium mytilinum]|uniref:D-xylose 1-dehydrogenase (NADP(+), D-xylono-1,5-lactone-forming) n=1 Tax=Lophium mytilinum TaxID=390894 RepID=A0A6A6QNL2_9PEZI|nr:NAD(P)-binding protein [Lophium mytilinum]